MGKYYGRWETYDHKYDDKLSEEENYQKFFDYFNDPNHKDRSWVFEECELTDEVIKEEYDSEIKRLIDVGLIKPPISSFHLHYIGWKEWSHSKSVHPFWNSSYSIYKMSYPCDLPYEIRRNIKDCVDYAVNIRHEKSYRLRENMKELCHLYDNYKNHETVTVDMEEVQGENGIEYQSVNPYMSNTFSYIDPYESQLRKMEQEVIDYYHNLGKDQSNIKFNFVNKMNQHQQVNEPRHMNEDEFLQLLGYVMNNNQYYTPTYDNGGNDQ